MPLLSHDYTSLRREIGVELGFNRDTAKWTAAETQDVEDVMKLGLQYFYSPGPLGRERTVHRWSFLRPIYTLSTVASQGDYTLPTDFAGIEGHITWVREGHLNCRIELVNEGVLRSLRQNSYGDVGTGPYCAATWPINSIGMIQQRYMLGLFPVPAGAFTLRFRYFASADTLSEENPHPLGMPIFADALRASMMAAAELKMDDERGKHWQNYLERIAIAISMDRSNNENGSLGFNLDRSVQTLDHESIREYTGLNVRTR